MIESQVIYVLLYRGSRKSSDFEKCTLGLPRRQVRKVPEPGTETSVILFRGRPGVQETRVSGGVTAVCIVFPVWRVLQSGLLCEQRNGQKRIVLLRAKKVGLNVIVLTFNVK
jgi:hypothetical protein